MSEQAPSSYPDWAPECLVQLDRIVPERPIGDDNPEEQVARMRQQPEFAEFKNNDEYWKQVTRRVYSHMSWLPYGQLRELLRKFLTDPRMKGVWASLEKRFTTDGDYYELFWTCQFTIVKWCSLQKQTPSERKRFYIELHETAKKLRRMIAQSDHDSISFFNVTSLLTNDDIDALIDELIEFLSVSIEHHTDKDDLRGLIQLTLHEVMPDICTILNNIANKALEALQDKPVVKKPKAEKARVHFFIRRLSAFFRGRYGQPLHDVVATITSVALDEDGIDADYVRKIVAPEGF